MVEQATEISGNAGQIRYFGEGCLVLNKPSGVISIKGAHQGGISAQDMVRNFAGNNWHPAHRLDRDTSGVMLFGEGKKVLAMLHAQFRERTVKKSYFALVDGCMDGLMGAVAPLYHDLEARRVSVEASDRAKQSVSAFTPLLHFVDRFGRETTQVDVSIMTGRTHQIRAHLAHLGFPISGDPWYNQGVPTSDRLMLHAYRLEFNLPVSGQRRTAFAPIPKSFWR